MNNVVNEIGKYLKVPFDEVLDYKYYVLSNNLINLMGYKKILSYTKESIIFSVKNNQLNILGKDLKIKELDKSSIVIIGKINRIFLSKEY